MTLCCVPAQAAVPADVSDAEGKTANLLAWRAEAEAAKDS